MYYIYIKKRLDDGARVEIRIRYDERSQTFIVTDVCRIEKGKRNGVWACGPRLTDSYTYRVLSMEDRRKREQEEICKMVPIDVLNEALIEAWQSTKPKLLEV